MDVLRVLKESLQLLRAKPKVFIPRLVTTAIYSLYLLYMAWAAADLTFPIQPEKAASMLFPSLLVLASLPLLYFIDILSHAMYPRIVADFRKGNKISLRESLKDGLRAWKVVVALELVLFAFVFIIAAPASVFAATYVYTGNIVPLAIASALAFCLIIAFAVLMFFVVPSAVLEKRGVVESFSKSMRLGVEHRGSLLKLNILFTALLGVTLAVAYYVKADNLLSLASAALFVGVRLLEAVTYTYVSVTNPTAYIHIQEAKS